MKRDYEAVVVGLGGLGSGAAYWLARRLGSDVLGLEQYELGHVRGGSQDHSRIIRYSYHAAAYVRLARQAYLAWETLERDAGRELVVKCGGLDLFPRDGESLSDYSTSLDAEGVPYELLSPDEVMRRWPQFRLGRDVRGLYQADGGFVRAAHCNAAHQHMARQYGATLLERVPTKALRATGNEFEVITDGGTFRAPRLILTAGAWANQLLESLGLNLPLTVTQEQVTYFEPSEEFDFAPDRFPVWIWAGQPCFYGFPAHETDGVKVAQDVGGGQVTAESRSFEPDPSNLARVLSFCEERLPGALRRTRYSKTCLYTMPPDRDFVIGAPEAHPSCWLAIGAGHAFKFASVIGRILSELALDGQTACDLGLFGLDRPALAQPGHPRSFRLSQ